MVKGVSLILTVHRFTIALREALLAVRYLEEEEMYLFVLPFSLPYKVIKIMVSKGLLSSFPILYYILRSCLCDMTNKINIHSDICYFDFSPTIRVPV